MIQDGLTLKQKHSITMASLSMYGHHDKAAKSPLEMVYRRTLLNAGDTFLENAANVESVNVRTLFQWKKGGQVPGG